jgi:5-methylcytosine-specific restriction endonuclease McrA
MPPCPKPKRTIDKNVIEKCREFGTCMLGGDCFGDLDVHHINSRGSGGGDVERNVILLCRRHHILAHAGKISKAVLYKRLEEII